MGPCAIPGTSNHGLGLAFDLEYGLRANQKKQDEAMEWARCNAFAFGFYWDSGDINSPGFENWHVTYCFGNDYAPIPLINNNINFLPTTPKAKTILIPASKKTVSSKTQSLFAKVQKQTIITPAKTVTVQPDAIPGYPKWWNPQSLDWFDTNKGSNQLPLNGFKSSFPSVT